MRISVTCGFAVTTKRILGALEQVQDSHLLLIVFVYNSKNVFFLRIFSVVRFKFSPAAIVFSSSNLKYS